MKKIGWVLTIVVVLLIGILITYNFLGKEKEVETKVKLSTKSRH